MEAMVPVVISELQATGVLAASLANRRSQYLSKMQEWLSESVLDLVLHWKESKMDAEGV